MNSVGFGAELCRQTCRILGIAAIAALASACAHPGPKAAVRVLPSEQQVDVSKQNLDPEKELDVLLQGKQRVGRAGGAAKRIAVPPFKVLGNTSVWMGEAASLVTMAHLSRADGVSVLDRGELTILIDELKRSQEPDPKTLAQMGKLLGAQELLVGSLVDAGNGRMRMYIRPVRVQDGVSLRAVQRELRVEHWADDLELALDEAKDTLLGADERSVVSPAVPMSRSDLELGARARALHYQGDLVAAEPLYARALAKPSSAWGLEADYVRLMTDLGMREYSRERARAVMARMPEGAESICIRARLQLEATRHKYEVAEAREAVRLAASCGDTSVQAMALRVYAASLKDIDYQMSLAAYRRALNLLGAKGNDEYERAWIEYSIYDEQYLDGLADQGIQAERYAEFAKRLEASGNLYGAGWAYKDASSNALYDDERNALLERGLAVAKRVGGDLYDSLRLQQVTFLRQQGQPSKADETILKIIGERLAAIAKLASGLPAIERRLDNDFLTAAGVRDLKSVSPGIPEAAKLLVRAHRVALAGALRTWADRTAPESARQADAYRAVSDELDPPKSVAPKDETSEQRFERLLKESNLSLSRLQQQDEAPLRGDVPSLSVVMDALWDQYWSLRKAKAPKAELQQTVLLHAKVSSWQRSPRQLGNSYRLAARFAIDQGQPDEAKRALQKARAQITEAPWFEATVLRWEIEIEQDVAKQRELRKKRAELAKRVALDDWVSALSDAVSDNTKTGNASCVQETEDLIGVSTELEERGAIEPAAKALSAAAGAINGCQNAEGSREAFAIMGKRSELLDKLKDPLRSLQGQADMLSAYVEWQRNNFRGGVGDQVRHDLVVSRLVRQIREGARELAAAGRYRDAVRIVATITPLAAGAEEALNQALEWSKSFRDSAEYPLLVAGIHDSLSDTATDTHIKVRELTAARLLYVQVKAWRKALIVQGAILSSYGDGAWLMKEFDKCVALAANAPGDLDSCYSGLGNAVINHDADLAGQPNLKRHVEQAMSQLPTWRTYSITYFLTLETDLAILALLAGDRAAFDLLNNEVKKYYTETAPSAYQWATHLARVADAAIQVDKDHYFRLYHDFDESRGSSEFWRAGAYYHAALTARGVNNADEERFFLERGRALSGRFPQYAAWYARYDVDVQLAQKNWAAAAKRYEAAAKLVSSRPVVVDDYTFAAAVVTAIGGDLSGAKAKLRPVYERIAEDGRSQTPCFDSLVLETGAAIAGAGHDCKEFDSKRQEAAAKRLQCTGSTAVQGQDYTDGLDDLVYRAPAKCGAPFVPNITRLPGIKSDTRQAIMEFGCSKGDLRACHSLGSVHRYRAGEQARAISVFERNCAAGYQESCVSLVAMGGVAAGRDDAQAFDMLRRACDAGNDGACRRQGEALLSGTGTPKDEARALERLGRACKLGSSQGCQLWIENGGQL